MRKEHECFGSVYLKQMLTSAQIKQVCNWSNTAFKRCVMLGLVYIATVYVVCEYHTYLTFSRQMASISADQSIETRTVPANLTLIIRCCDSCKPSF